MIAVSEEARESALGGHPHRIATDGATPWPQNTGLGATHPLDVHLTHQLPHGAPQLCDTPP
ncbi:hypothetical protein [Streptomyces sp. NPDC005231]|uniref:hypothetical protein n=1 Tax=Streptomyces sp. NPDC005231 TaxID=3157026 RepID=UPI0033B1BEC5